MGAYNKQIKVTASAYKMLDELSVKRKTEGEPIKTKQDITIQAIIALYKKEIGNRKGD